MAGRYTDQFFGSISDQSRTKHRIYQAYLVPWSQKLGSQHRRIWVVDGFAGPGVYVDGSPGSPLLAMQRSAEVAASGRFSLQCLFADRNAERRARLRRLAASYPASSAQLLEGDFWSRAHQIPDIVRSEPCLLFVDPFGLKGIDFETLAQLCARLDRVDVLVNLRTPAASRLEPRHSDLITRSVGSTDWTPETVGEVFRRNLGSRARFLRPASLAVRQRFGGRIQTEIVLASRHPAAYELWNDISVTEVEKLASSDGMDPAARDENLSTIVGRLENWARGKQRWNRTQVIDWHVVEHCGDAHTGTIKRAVTQLLTRGDWIRDGTRGIDTDSMRHRAG